jgi:hypothetical protein
MTDHTDHTDHQTDRPRWWTFALMGCSLTLVALVYAGGAVWSFHEQSKFALTLGFESRPWLLPIVLDGMVAAMASVALVVSLQGRSAFRPRMVTMIAITLSALSNAVAAWNRTEGETTQVTATIVATIIPVAAAVAWEALLDELRSQIILSAAPYLAKRKIPGPRAIRLLLSPRTILEWRLLVLEMTTPVNPITGRPVIASSHVDVEVTAIDQTDQPITRRPITRKRTITRDHSADQTSITPPIVTDHELVQPISRPIADQLPIEHDQDTLITPITRVITGGEQQWAPIIADAIDRAVSDRRPLQPVWEQYAIETSRSPITLRKWVRDYRATGDRSDQTG